MGRILLLARRPVPGLGPSALGQLAASTRLAVPAFDGTTSELARTSLKAVDSPIPLP